LQDKTRIQIALNRILILAAALAIIAGLLAAHWDVVLRYARLL
jgi:hypothetical protein